MRERRGSQMRDDPYPWTVHLWADETHRATVCGAPQGRTEGPAGSTVYLCEVCRKLSWQHGEEARAILAPPKGDRAVSERRSDEVWADEGGRSLRVTAIDAGHVIVEIGAGVGGSVVARVTLGRWRWERIVRAMAPTDPGGGGAG